MRTRGEGEVGGWVVKGEWVIEEGEGGTSDSTPSSANTAHTRHGVVRWLERGVGGRGTHGTCRGDSTARTGQEVVGWWWWGEWWEVQHMMGWQGRRKN